MDFDIKNVLKDINDTNVLLEMFFMLWKLSADKNK